MVKKYCKDTAAGSIAYNENKMSPTSISGGGKLLTGGELISPASLKGQDGFIGQQFDPVTGIDVWKLEGKA